MNLLSSANIKNLLVLLLCLLLQPLSAQEGAPADETESYEVQKRIVGGTEVKLDTSGTSFENGWSAVAALMDNRQSHFCGASLIDNKWLLTAAHCLYRYGYIDTSLEISALFEQTDADNASLNKSLSRKVINSIIHPDYDYRSDENDVALLELEQPVDSIAPIKIPGKFYDTPIVEDGTLATVLGWGFTKDKVDDKNTLFRSVQIPVVKVETCKNNYAKRGYNISLNMLCAGYNEGGKDACTGDSGGPLLIPSLSGTGWDQVGIVSFGIGCGLPDLFGVYTRVSRYHDFIQSKICHTQLPIPHLEIKRDRNLVNISLITTDKRQHYRLYYAPTAGITPIQYFEIHNTNSLTLEMPKDENKQWYVIARMIDGNCSSGFSNLATLK